MKLLIVDDQKEVVDSLLEEVQWEKLSIEEVYTARSAEAAKKILTAWKVDILLTDIEMPGEDGLALFSWTREHFPDVECVFLTSHADFEYAKRAIQLGGFDYILQPARREEIEEVTARVIQKILKDRKRDQLEKMDEVLFKQRKSILDHATSKLLRIGIREGLEEFERVEFLEPGEKLAFLCHIAVVRWNAHREAWDEKLLQYTFLNVLEELIGGAGGKVLVSQSMELEGVTGFWAPIFTVGSEKKEQITACIRQFYDFLGSCGDFQVALYYGAVREESFSRTKDSILQSRRNNVMEVSELVDVYKQREKLPGPTVTDNGLGQRWANMLTRGEYEALEREIQVLIQRLQCDNKLTLDVMKRIHYYFIKAMNLFTDIEVGNIIFDSMENQLEYQEFLNNYRSYDSFMKGVSFCLGAIRKHRNSNKEDVDSLEEAIRYVDKNLHRNVTRKEVADHVFLNEDYFSRAFRKKTGKSFKNYVTEKKIEYAKELLEHTGFSISIIASKAGYDNFSYFAKIFKKVTNLSPQEYRQQKMKNRI